MIKQRLIFIAGIIVALMPYSGFPVSWKNTFFVILGLLITFLSYFLYREKKNSLPQKKEGSETFTENRTRISDIQKSRILE